MHIHLQKCRKQHPNAKKATCPFDATHIVNDVEIDFHVTVCPKRHMLDSQMFVLDDDYRPQVAVHSSAPTSVDPNEESWDNENTQSYKPDPAKKGAHIIMKVKGATPSERRKARMEGVKNYRPLQ
ncbi:unnamed protein product [Arctia plantaginis]|nr:unnamed protein product [Arctia plantaginis]